MHQIVPAEDLPKADQSLDVLDVWQIYEKDPKFFAKLDIAEDGGFGEVHCLFDSHRFFWTPVPIFCMFMNLGLVVGGNLWTLSHLSVSLWVTDTYDGAQRWLILNQLIGYLFGGKQRLNHEVLLAFLELLMFAYYLAIAARTIARILFCPGGQPWQRWRSIAALFWDLLPDLQVASAMKCLYFVTPSVLTRDATQKVQRELNKKAWHASDGFVIAKFFLGRCLLFLVGFEAFMIKFNHTAQAVRLAHDELSAMLSSLAFLNQVLGVVSVRKFTHRRLFILIFGGEDGFLSKREEQISATWLGMLAEKMWKAAGQADKKSSATQQDKKLNWWLQLAWFLSLALTYSDEDFQKLILNEEAKRKQRISLQQLSDGQVKANTFGASVTQAMSREVLTS